MTTCSNLINSYLYIFMRYDTDFTGTISQTEAVNAYNDYATGKITFNEWNAVDSFYSNNCWFGCADIVNHYLSVLQRYDIDRSGTINQTEASKAVTDYLNGLITRYDALAIDQAYRRGCTFAIVPCRPVSCTMVVTVA